MFRLSLAIYVVAVIVLVLQCARPGQAAAIGRILNKDHDAVFAEQKKALARAKERKPFLACPAGHVPCLASAEGETVADDVVSMYPRPSSLVEAAPYVAAATATSNKATAQTAHFSHT
ncbi:MAG: hypothetical protein CYPHOPRED_001952 [Cyphobasidiales sp. Tagirdzhanova-0007]|nr:MAG: hypothetical protein CYPHOPRED_001952 [Cyphobasidiales sp. Tagirdzhanova-0007]